MSTIERDENIALGLTGVFQIMGRYTNRGGDDYNQFGKLTAQELVTMHNCATNEEDALINGLRTLGDLVSCYDRDAGGNLDHNGVGWMVKMMAETLEDVTSMKWVAADELARRGYTSSGEEIPRQKAKAA